MIRILQLKLPVLHTEKELEEKILHTLRIRPEELKSWKIVRRSIDARKKDALCFVYQIDVETPKEKKILARSKHNEIMSTKLSRYHFPKPGNQTLRRPPVVIGSGLAGEERLLSRPAGTGGRGPCPAGKGGTVLEHRSA